MRAFNLANGGNNIFKGEDFAMMTNLHYLILNGCNVSGDLESI